MDIDRVHRSIQSFLTQRIEKKIESEQKKLKEDFTTEHAQKIHDDHEIFSWMNYIAENASKVSLNVSHVAKLSHSSNKAINLVDQITQTKNLHLITTQTANASDRDSGYIDASYAPVADFLSFVVDNSEQSLGQFLASDARYFNQITDNEEIQKRWQESIAQAYVAKKLSSHVLAKQIYLPVENEQYHVISPVKSSALAHKIFYSIAEARSKDNEVNQARKAELWHEGTYVYFPKTAFISVTKSNHQNASKLNGARRGGLYLFQATPPQWKSNQLRQQKNKNPPTSIQYLLSRCVNQNTLAILKEIQRLLYVVKKQGLSINLNRKNILAETITALCDEIFNQILLIEDIYPMGWSDEYKIEIALKIFIDNKNSSLNNLSNDDIKRYIDDFIEQVTIWISQHIGDTHRTKSLEKLWTRMLQPLFRDFYAVLMSE
ncbi:type I-F CRISPR-associated protein Csy1 [uncultured Acinetobacter sp.]|uniref:type I-F CRISPR-associated protein Csy1 n=1 Tax=uncultured Acinetobacter sp. TaxID=165433 RepID=UPI00258C9F19|nr:type I-F CRISPR-associated protein Csy1 [uncultured Acinetobacter sp.]